ncbi:MAG: LamG domain-containing protein, partial [Planctomycetota bacterium]
MCKKLSMLASFILVLSVAVSTQADLVGYWTFDEGSGTIAYDSSGNGLDGTFNGDPQWVIGQVGGALEFDGDDSVEIPHNDLLSITDEITITAWTYMNANASGEMAIVSKGGWGAMDLPYELTETPGAQIWWQFYDDGGRDTCAAPSPPIEEWHHVAATYDGQIFKCYIDGELGDEWEYAGTMPENTASLTIGQRSRGGTYYIGIIDDVAIYNRAFSADEIPNTMMGMGDFGQALGPTPADGSLVEDTWVSLSWRPGDFAVSHDVYIGDNFDAVSEGAEGTFIGNQADTFLVIGFPGFPYPDGLVPGTTYYWRIDEVN